MLKKRYERARNANDGIVPGRKVEVRPSFRDDGIEQCANQSFWISRGHACFSIIFIVSENTSEGMADALMMYPSAPRDFARSRSLSPPLFQSTIIFALPS